MCDKEKKCTCGCEDEGCNCEHEDCKCENGECECGHEDCDCGCEFGEDIVELTTDDGKKLKFYFIGTIEYNGKSYCAFEPAEEIEGLTEDDMVIFELSDDDGEESSLLPIEDEALLDAVYAEFEKAMEEEDEE